MGTSATPLNLTPAQLKVMASSIRLAVLQHLEAEGEATAKELATRLGRPATALYHHLEKLLAAGLIVPAGQRETDRRPETVYGLASSRLSSANAVRTPSGRNALVGLATRVIASSLRAFSAAAVHAAARFDGPQRQVAVRHVIFRADRRHLARINALIDSLEEATAHSSDDGESMLLTVVLAPRTASEERPKR